MSSVISLIPFRVHPDSARVRTLIVLDFVNILKWIRTEEIEQERAKPKGPLLPHQYTVWREVPGCCIVCGYPTQHCLHAQFGRGQRANGGFTLAQLTRFSTDATFCRAGGSNL
jgi:hypothetical protein